MYFKGVLRLGEGIKLKKDEEPKEDVQLGEAEQVGGTDGQTQPNQEGDLLKDIQANKQDGQAINQKQVDITQQETVVEEIKPEEKNDVNIPEGSSENLLREQSNYIIKQFDQLNDSKKHLEYKCLYVLQAAAVLVALFVGLMQLASGNRFGYPWQKVFTYLQIMFYLVNMLTFWTLFRALDDAVLNKKYRLKVRFRNILNDEKEDTKTVKGSFEKLLDIDFVIRYNTVKELSEHYRILIDTYRKSYNSLFQIVILKNKLLLRALKFFIVAIIILSIIGYMLMW